MCRKTEKRHKFCLSFGDNSTKIEYGVINLKLSMWHILRDLEDFQPEYTITDGAPRISGLHLHSRWDGEERQPQYATLRLLNVRSPIPSGEDDSFTMEITNGPDVITVRDLSDSSVLVNRLMALLANYSDWEARLRYAAGRNDLQEVVDIATEKLDNPILLFDMESHVLAMSSLFLDDEISPFWSFCRDTRRLPIGYSAQSMTLEGGDFAAWTREPKVYNMPGGAKSIGNFISLNGRIAAGFALHEHDNPIRPGDLHLVRLAEECIRKSLQAPEEDHSQRTLIQTIQDILAGVEYADSVLSLLHLPGEGPWRLLIVSNPYHNERDPIYRQLLLPRLRGGLSEGVSLEFDNHIVVIVPLSDIEAALRVINGGAEQPCFSVCLSLPFADIRLLRIRYRQTMFALGRTNGQPGLYYGENTMLDYLGTLQFGKDEAVIHPLLDTLKTHDAQKGSELYDTLFQYLVNERSIQKGANALHVHKNTYSYRLDRIKALSSIDLDDPLTRLYLMISYVIDGALDRPDGGR